MITIQESIWDRLRDGTHWRDREGTQRPIGLMKTSHIRNVLAYLERRADRLKMSYELMLIRGPQPSGDAACDAFDAAMDHLYEQDPIEWLNEWPLIINLRAELAHRELVTAMWGEE